MSARLSLSRYVACLLIPMAAACSIKEDRSDCPCRLRLDMSGTATMSHVKVNVAASDGSLFSDEYVPAGTVAGAGNGHDGAALIFEIPRGPAEIAAAAGDDGRFSDGNGLRIPLGEECPPVYTYCSTVDASGEYCEDKIVLSKNYCRISVKMTGESGAVYPFSLETLGNVSGYGFDMTPEHGDFRYVMNPDAEGIFHVNVPRQYDSSLILRVAEDDRSLRDFAIGEYLEEGGYDWTARELADVELVIDYAKADLTLTVEDWEVSFGFNVVI